uniref:Actin-related protein 5 n=1 Tax=Trichuris muris TaxID=70415 RepID=A0A5S6Q6E8_TRIMR
MMNAFMKWAEECCRLLPTFRVLDDVNALIFDPGSSTFRVGYSGEPYPKYYLPSVFGYLPNEELPSHRGIRTGAACPLPTLHRPSEAQRYQGKEAQYYFHPNSLCVPRERMEMKPLLEDGMIDDWDMFETLMRYCFQFCFFDQQEGKPIFFTEPFWNYRDKRETLTELMFETFAVYDGIPLFKSTVHTPLGGDFLNDSFVELLKSLHVDIIPSYMVFRKELSGQNNFRVCMKRTPPKVTRSYHDNAVKMVIEDLKCTVLRLHERPLRVSAMATLPKADYELPDSRTLRLKNEHFQIAESLFQPFYPSVFGKDLPLQSITGIAWECLNSVDIELRPVLPKHLLLTGGTTLIPGFERRFLYDFSTRCFMPEVRVITHHMPSFLDSTTAAFVGGSNHIPGKLLVDKQATIRGEWKAGHSNDHVLNCRPRVSLLSGLANTVAAEIACLPPFQVEWRRTSSFRKVGLPPARKKVMSHVVQVVVKSSRIPLRHCCSHLIFAVVGLHSFEQP